MQRSYVLSHVKKKIEIEGDQDAELNFADVDINQATLWKTSQVHYSDLKFCSGVKTSLTKLQKLKKANRSRKTCDKYRKKFYEYEY